MPMNRKIKTLPDFEKDRQKLTGKPVSVSTSNSSLALKGNRISSSVIEANKNCKDSRNVFCPIPGCRNFGGRGFRRAGISKHLMGQHSDDLVRSSPNFVLVDRLLQSLGRKVCIICTRITIRCTEKGFCDKCDKKRPVADKILNDLTRNQREKSTLEIISIQKTNFLLRRTGKFTRFGQIS